MVNQTLSQKLKTLFNIKHLIKYHQTLDIPVRKSIDIKVYFSGMKNIDRNKAQCQVRKDKRSFH